jgi:hypothetical protein
MMNKIVRLLLFMMGMTTGGPVLADSASGFSQIKCAERLGTGISIISSTSRVLSSAVGRRYRISTDARHYYTFPNGIVDPPKSHTISKPWQITTSQTVSDSHFTLSLHDWHVRGTHFIERCGRSGAWVEMGEPTSSADGCG